MTDSIEISLNLSPTFRELLGRLFNEPFAIQSGFLELTFEEIGLILEEPLEESSQLLEAYNSCKSTYCLLLVELDLCGYTSLPKEISERPLKDFSCWVETSEPVEPLSVGETKAQEIIDELNLEIDEQPVTNLNPISEISAPQFEVETSLQNPAEILDLSSAFKNIAYFLKKEKDSTVLNTSHEAAQRTAIHCLICASEAKLFTLLKEPISRIWPSRLKKIESLLIQGQFKFNEITNAKIDSDEKEFKSFLFDEKFPRLAALHCLKYLTLTQTIESLHPSVFELATFLYFWGPQIFAHRATSQEPTETKLAVVNTTELAFRLCRLDRIKAHANNFNRPLTESYLDQVIEDVEKLLTLDSNKSTDPQKQVA
jgi:hypothetical protein